MKQSSVYAMLFRAGVAIVMATTLDVGCCLANETVTYTYDVLGRLVKVANSGSINTGQQSTYSFDAADNRTTVVSTTSVIVVPLNGFTIIPIPAH
jgi:hypothetical protein